MTTFDGRFRTAGKTLLCVFGVSLNACAALSRAHYPRTPALEHLNADSGYRFQNLPAAGGNSDSLFVVLAFSGGGTRAAALAYGVLRELQQTQIGDTTLGTKTLLDEVDVISSVSGGSFAAAYYALHGPEKLRNFERDFLFWDAQGALVGRVASKVWRLRSPYYNRIDVAAELWDERLFHGATFDTLARLRRRPFVIINASDMSVGDPFSFTQEQFDPLCGNLGGVSLARAVAASSAFPGALSPITIENHADRCRYVLPRGIANALHPTTAADNPERYRRARTYVSYRNAATRPFIHLLDGGLADNIGLRPILRSMSSLDPEWSLLRMTDARAVRRVVVIVVNAKTSKRSTIEASAKPPGIGAMLQTVIDKPMGNYSQESIGRLREAEQSVKRQVTLDSAVAALLREHCPDAALPFRPPTSAQLHTIEVSFEGIVDSSEREFYLNLPTSFRLPPTTVRLLTNLGGRLLRESDEYRALIELLRR